MSLFCRRGIAAALLLLSAPAGAVMTLVPDVEPATPAQAVIVPLYYAQSPYSTDIVLTNQSTSGATGWAVHFKEAEDGREVMAPDQQLPGSLFVFLAAKKSVTLHAAAAGTSGTVTVSAQDASTCLSPDVSHVPGKFLSAGYTGSNNDGGSQTATRALHGYLEIIPAVDLLRGTAAYNALLASSCASIQATLEGNPSQSGPPTGALSVAASISGPGGTANFRTVGINGFTSVSLFTSTGSNLPSLSQANDPSGVPGTASALINGVPYTFSKPIDAVSALLLASGFSYTTNPFTAATASIPGDFLGVTYPTKRFYTDGDQFGLSAPLAPFASLFGPGQSCVPLTFTYARQGSSSPTVDNVSTTCLTTNLISFSFNAPAPDFGPDIGVLFGVPLAGAYTAQVDYASSRSSGGEGTLVDASGSELFLGQPAIPFKISFKKTASTDLAISLVLPTGASTTYRPGDPISFNLNVSLPAGSASASNVAVAFAVPANFVTLSSSSCAATINSGQAQWNVGALTAGASAACVISGAVNPQAIGAFNASASVSATQTDSNPGNNSTTVSLLVYQPPVAVSTVSGKPTTQDSQFVVLSNTGSTVVFQSRETDLVAGNVNSGGQDIYRVAAGKAVLENTDASGHQLSGTASLPALSGDGNVVAFVYSTSKARRAKDGISIQGQIYGGSTGQGKHPVDVGEGGAPPNGSASGAPSVSSGGGIKRIAFCSAASNLVDIDTNGANDVFLGDPTNPTQGLQLVSRDGTGVQIPGDSCEPKLSADGSKVVFTTRALALFGNARQVVRKDLVTGKLEVISINAATSEFANADCTEPSINADGSVISFTSAATNLDSLGAPVGGHEVFVALAQSGSDNVQRILRRVRSGDGTVPNGLSQHSQLSNDGNVLVMQTFATNFFGAAKATAPPVCGAIAITTNFFSPASIGSSLCNGATSNQNPAVSGDGSTVGFDSNAPQTGTASNNSNAYTQGLSGLDALGKSNFAGDFSGQWFDPSQSGQGLVIDVLPPQSSGDHNMSVIWFVYAGGKPTWLIGSGVPHPGTGTDVGKTVVQISQVGIFQGRSFPLGEPNASAVVWGSFTLSFADANTGVMSWTSTYPGFNSGSMPITHFLPVGVPANDAAGAQVKACYSGNWKEPTKSGHGFEFELVPSNPPVLAVDWFAYDPSGAPVWLQGAGTVSGNGATMQLQLIDGAGAQFPPLFDNTQLTQHIWGNLSVTFSDATHAHATWNSTLTGYGSGSIDLVPTFGLDRRSCH